MNYTIQLVADEKNTRTSLADLKIILFVTYSVDLKQQFSFPGEIGSYSATSGISMFFIHYKYFNLGKTCLSGKRSERVKANKNQGI